MLKGTTNEEKIWNYLVDKVGNKLGVAGLMGNLQAESGFSPINLQNSCNKRLNISDEEYTMLVDGNNYPDFVKDSAGYGIAQWTFYTRKQNLLDYAKSKKKSIGDLEMQLEFLMVELNGSYKGVLNVLKSAKDVKTASDICLTQLERPKDQSIKVKDYRASLGQAIYDKYNNGGTSSMGRKRSEIVSQAQSWLGCKESDGSHKKIIDLYNKHTPLARGYKVKYTDAWCATFGSACAIAKGYTDIIPTECGCNPMIELFKKMGCWEENDAYVPNPGDYIFYDWQDNGVGDNKGSADHVGIVEKVEGALITVIEGNCSDMVKRRSIAVNGQYIRGYGVPKYDKETTVKPVTPTPVSKSDYTLVNKNAKVGYASSKDNSIAGTYKATTDLNMRVAAGKVNKSGKENTIILTLKSGAEVKCYGYYSVSDGTKWYLVAIDSYAGFVSSKYLKRV